MTQKRSVVCDIMTHLDLGSSIKLLDPNARFQHFSYGFKQNLSLIIKLG